MIKKTMKVLKLAVIFTLWSGLLLFCTQLLFKHIWHFDIFYKKQWSVVAKYWENNGVINGASDYLFFLTLVLLFILWLGGLFFIPKINFAKVLIFPIEYIINYRIKQYENEDTHVVIKNISVSEKLTVEDIIQERMQKESVNRGDKEADILRKNISEKIIKRKE